MVSPKTRTNDHYRFVPIPQLLNLCAWVPLQCYHYGAGAAASGFPRNLKASPQTRSPSGYRYGQGGLETKGLQDRVTPAVSPTGRRARPRLWGKVPTAKGDWLGTPDTCFSADDLMAHTDLPYGCASRELEPAMLRLSCWDGGGGGGGGDEQEHHITITITISPHNHHHHIIITTITITVTISPPPPYCHITITITITISSSSPPYRHHHITPSPYNTITIKPSPYRNITITVTISPSPYPHHFHHIVISPSPYRHHITIAISPCHHHHHHHYHQ